MKALICSFREEPCFAGDAPDQKIVYTRRDDVRLSMGTGLTAHMGLIAPKHFMFLDRDTDNFCPSKSMPSTLMIFARQIRNEDSEFNEGEKNRKAQGGTYKERHLQKRPDKTTYGKQNGDFILAGFSYHMVFMLSQYYDDTAFFLYEEHLP